MNRARFRHDALSTIAISGFAIAILGCAMATPSVAAGTAATANTAGAAASQTAQSTESATGIALDAPWKRTIYTLARTSFVHPAWGWQHSERNYNLALEFARADGLMVDRDVLFAAAFLHDMAAFAPFEKDGMEHGDRAAESSEAVLRDAGFPMAKFPAVAAAEKGHMFYSGVDAKYPEVSVLHDADSVDFLGAVGAARMLAIVGEKAPSVSKTVAQLRSFAHDIPAKLLTKSGRALGASRAAELTAFLDRLDTETTSGSLR